MAALDCGFEDGSTTGDLACCWPIDPEKCCEEISELPDPLADPQVVAAMAEASAILTRLSAYSVGLCSTVIRPLDICPECRSWCCGGTDGLHLQGPNGMQVRDVTDVRLGASSFPVNEWFFDREKQTLWRVPPDTWPTRDERWSEVGTGEAFAVDVIVGTKPDAWALSVAASLTCELYKSCLGSKCRLPRNATSVSAQGVTVTLTEDEIRHFIPEVSAWVKQINPHDARLPTLVSSPDIGPSRSSRTGRGVGGCCGC